MKYKIRLTIVIVLILFSLDNSIAQEIPELHEVFSVSLPTSIPENLTHYEKTDNFIFSKNVLDVETIIKYKKIQYPEFTYSWQSDDDTRTIYDLRILRNGISTNQPTILKYEKKGEKFVATSKPFPLNSTDEIIANYKMGNAVRPANKDILFFNISLTEFFYPFDTYKIKMMEPPTYINIKERKIVIEGLYNIDENETFFQCPNKIGEWVKVPLIHRITGEKINFTINVDLNLNDQKSKMNVIEEDKSTTIIFEPIRSTQSSLTEEYFNQTTDYIMNESNSCVLNLQYKSRFPWLLVIILSILILISSYISTNKYYHAKNTKLRKYCESSIIYFITPLLAIYAISIFWINRPITPTMLDILIIVMYILLSIVLCKIFKKNHKNRFIKNTRK